LVEASANVLVHASAPDDAEGANVICDDVAFDDAEGATVAFNLVDKILKT
jgi:hypothetical protein